MKFKTKFNVEDTAWCMKNNSPIKVFILGIKIVEYGNGSQQRAKLNGIKYVTIYSRDRQELYEGDHFELHEDNLFESKNKLLESLFGDDAKVCKGESCTAINGINHSPECIEEHDALWEREVLPGTKDALSKLSV